MDSEAARLAATLQAVMKSQNLSGPALADKIEQLTGARRSRVWISRRLTGYRPLIRISPDLADIARALGIDPVQLVTDVYAATLADAPAGDTGAQ